MPTEDFHKREPVDLHRCRELAHSLYQAILKIFPKKIGWTKIHQCKQKPGETIFDYFEGFKKIYKQHSGMASERFQNHQNDPVLNSIF